MTTMTSKKTTRPRSREDWLMEVTRQRLSKNAQGVANGLFCFAWDWDSRDHEVNTYTGSYVGLADVAGITPDEDDDMKAETVTIAMKELRKAGFVETFRQSYGLRKPVNSVRLRFPDA